MDAKILQNVRDCLIFFRLRYKDYNIPRACDIAGFSSDRLYDPWNDNDIDFFPRTMVAENPLS